MADRLYTVNREPFVIPARYSVVSGVEGGSQNAFVVRCTVHSTSTELLIRRLPGALDPERSSLDARTLIARFLRLHCNIHAESAGIQPLVDAYRSPLTPGDLYVVYPPASLTLAAAGLLGGGLLVEQIATITRELCRTLKFLHQNGVAIGTLRPSAILVEAALGLGDSVRITDLIGAIAVPSVQRRGATAVVKSASAGTPVDSLGLSEDSVRVLSVADVLLQERGTNTSAISDDKKNLTRLWYRAPELVLGDSLVTQATAAVDMWSLGCIVLELATRRPFIPASNKQQFATMIAEHYGASGEYTKVLGDTPWAREAAIIAQGRPSASLAARLAGTDQRIQYLVSKLLRLNPVERLSAAEILQLPFFGEVTVHLAAFTGAGPSAAATRPPVSSAVRAAEAAAAAAAASAPVTLPPNEIISPDWAIRLGTSDSIVSDAIDALLVAQHTPAAA